MAELFFADLVRETSQSAGAGALALAGAVPGHRRFADVVPSGATFHYAIAGVAHPGQWETGEGQLDADGELLRSPLASSAGGAAVDFLAGTKSVTLTVGADWFAAQQAGLTAKAGLAGAAFTGAVFAPALTLGDDLGLEHGGTGASTAAGARDNLGLVIGSDVAAFDAALDALAAMDDDPGLVEQTGPDGFAKRAVGISAATSIPSRADADARYAALGHGHAIGDVAGLQSALDARQPADAELTALAALPSAADRLPYFTGVGAASLTALTGFGRSLIDDADAAAARTTIGLGSVENKSSATIRGELTGGNVTAALGFTPANKAGESFTGPVSVTGALAASGVVTLSGDHAFPGATTSLARMYRSAALGLVVYGAGSAFDLLVCNKNGGTVLSVPTGSANADFAGTISVAGAQVVGARRTGWAASSGTAARGAFDTATVTTAQLAERVKALIDDLIAHGLIGS